MRQRRRCRKHRRGGEERQLRPGPLGRFSPISTRPAAAGGRHEVGHLEGDLIIGARNDLGDHHRVRPGQPLRVVGRSPRGPWRWRDPGRTRRDLRADPRCAVAHTHLPRDGPPRRSRRAERIDVYFAEPHSPWQRPTTENGNGLLRRYVGKGTNLSACGPADLRAIERRINTMPRRSFHWSTAATVYDAAVAMTG